MIIVDRLLRQRESEGRPLRIGLIGAGFMARGIARQILQSVPGMDLVAIANRDVQRARRCFEEAGDEQVLEVDAVGALEDALRAGRRCITADAGLLCESESIDCLIDATGAIEFGAGITLKAFDCGKPLVSMNAELDGTVGSILRERADRAGMIFTACDGDQPGVQMNLFRFVRGIGAQPLVCGNIKGLQDPYRNPTTQRGFAERWGQNVNMVTSFADGTKISFEQAIVANATGMTIARRGMIGREHAGHVDELTQCYDVDALRALGGVVDYVVGSRPGPGVFVLAAHDDPFQQHYLNLYKLGEGPLYCFYTPYHLCHFEVPMSAARVLLCGDAVMQPLDGPRVEVVATAKVDMAAGELVDGLGGYKTYGQCETAAITRAQSLLPMGLAEGCVLRRAVAKDQVLTYDDVERPQGRLIDQLRAEQDQRWP